ncbi:hypothetical protein HS088_TW09G00700 [Tripterygium wilfordii]|uniref:DUF674 family protein n=1 Tax=Tripterygium wilfordii TaxID=458696 RepID=A0A7J7D8S0_TRIWF|nr:uncharacterized protein LOC120006611 [Tripterygium wilfordii]KAF5742649.1 hypothetical protein HS088_TW09G00700 [Tripterygium wilfordii]
MATTTTLGMKLLMDTRRHRIIFAEANKEVVDFVFTFLSLPVGLIFRVMGEKHEMVGCLGNLYKSVQDLDSTYLQPNKFKAHIWLPIVANFSGIIKSIPPTTVYRCHSDSCCGIDNVAFDRAATCPQCDGIMNKEVTCVHASSKGFVKGEATYMITDDLTVKPMSALSIIGLMNKFNVKEVGDVQEKFINFSVDKRMKIFKASLVSKTVLTDVFLGEILESEE